MKPNWIEHRCHKDLGTLDCFLVRADDQIPSLEQETYFVWHSSHIILLKEFKSPLTFLLITGQRLPDHSRQRHARPHCCLKQGNYSPAKHKGLRIHNPPSQQATWEPWARAREWVNARRICQKY